MGITHIFQIPITDINSEEKSHGRSPIIGRLNNEMYNEPVISFFNPF